ncbi:hypothetical protein HZA55_03295 [Candidatus Poribacteria bacterium]|nr:hypothetical protein [Candidatus Poribacteria bacterium]
MKNIRCTFGFHKWQDYRCKFCNKSFPFDNLVNELIRVIDEANHWGHNNKYPVFENYPQYPTIRKLGEQIHEVAGIEGMRKACEILDTSLKHPDPFSFPHSTAEFSWRGIGNWMP